MTKTLKTIQTIMKVGRIIAKILLVLFIIGAVLSLIGFLLLIAGVDTLVGFITEANAEVDIGDCYFNCIWGCISGVANAVLAWLAIKYFNQELSVGTPFTFDGAKELFRLGIINLSVVLGLSVMQTLIYGIIWIYFPTIETSNTEFSFSAGLLMLILSLVFKHGAEISSPYDSSFGDDVKEEIKF